MGVPELPPTPDKHNHSGNGWCGSLPPEGGGGNLSALKRGGGRYLGVETVCIAKQSLHNH